jgi:hypothetical protein
VERGQNITQTDIKTWVHSCINPPPDISAKRKECPQRWEDTYSSSQDEESQRHENQPINWKHLLLYFSFLRVKMLMTDTSWHECANVFRRESIHSRRICISKSTFQSSCQFIHTNRNTTHVFCVGRFTDPQKSCMNAPADTSSTNNFLLHPLENASSQTALDMQRIQKEYHKRETKKPTQNLDCKT